MASLASLSSHVLILTATLTAPIAGQPPSSVPLPVHLTIPFLANATRPSDIDFMAAQCDVHGDRMECRFRQLFLTPSSLDASSCAITTNGFDWKFRRETPTRWVRRSAPDGDCGVVETTILEDGGGTRWTLRIETAATQHAERAACRAESQEPEIYDWRSVKRALPCTSVQPGAIER
jgi:hypothetical protein